MTIKSTKADFLEQRILLTIVAVACMPLAAAAQIFESPANPIVAHCGDQGIRLKVRVNNGLPQNPHQDYSVDLGLGVEGIRDPMFTINPNGECVLDGNVTLLLGEISSDNCPSECTITINIDYFYENDDPNGSDNDQRASYDENSMLCPPPLLDDTEALRAAAQAVFEIRCIEDPPRPAKGVGSAEGQQARAYVDGNFTPTDTLIAFDLTGVRFELIPAAVVRFHVGTPDGPNLVVGEVPVPDASFQQFDAVVPTSDLEPYRDAQGRLQYFVTDELEELLFTSDFGLAPVIFEHPQSVVVCEGDEVLLSVTAEGEAPLSYVWERNGEFYEFGSPFLSFAPVTEADEGLYQVFIGNAYGNVHSQYARIWVQQPGELPPVLVEPMRVPERWQSESFQWGGDTSPPNKIDDAIDDAGPGTYDVIVNFRVPTGEMLGAVLSNFGTVQYIGQHIPSICVSGVSYADLQTIAADPDVAFIEEQLPVEYYLDVAKQATKVSAGFYSPDTVADNFPTIDGSGVNIVIFDSGVRSAHADLPPALFAYDALTQTMIDPDDVVGHGTHVAGIALGRGTAFVAPGVAPAAGLIDVRAGNSGQSFQALDQVLIPNVTQWNIGVVNMSLGWGSNNDDGQDAISTAVNRLVGQGVVVVCAAGNNGPSNNGLRRPAAADLAITVANSQDQSTPDRSDDTLRSSSSRGPRLDDNDLDCIDELKPEIAAPGTNIFSADWTSPDGGVNETGTSMSSPHVAGVAALMLQGNPGLTPAAIEQALLSTAERHGTASAPACDPDWNDGWGWGLLEANAAVAAAFGTGGGGAPGPTNLLFVGSAPHVYASNAIMTVNPPKVGVPNTIEATIENTGVNAAINVNVKFKIDYISAANWSFYDVGTVTIPLLAAGQQAVASIAWTPQHPDHQCLKAEIAYAPDTGALDNHVQRNITVAHSPVRFRVENLVSRDPILVEFLADFEHPSAGWDVVITPPLVQLEPGAFAWIEALPVPPDGTPDGTQETIYISAVKDGCMLLGGVGIVATMSDCNGNGIDDWFDIQDGTSLDLNGNEIPDECELPGDVNCDGLVNFDDINPFVAALVGQAAYEEQYPDCNWFNADTNGDGIVNFDDIDSFVTLLAGGG
jgi:subtilisin family serine protease